MLLRGLATERAIAAHEQLEIQECEAEDFFRISHFWIALCIHKVHDAGSLDAGMGSIAGVMAISMAKLLTFVAIDQIAKSSCNEVSKATLSCLSLYASADPRLCRQFDSSFQL